MRLAGAEDDAGNAVSLSRDANGNVTQRVETDAAAVGNDEAFTTTYSYDGLNRVTSAVNNDNKTTSYEYDAAGMLSRVVDADGVVTALRYDGAGRLVETARDAAGLNIVTRRKWDRNGRVVERVDPLGNATRYVYDALGRVTRENYADGTARWGGC